MRGGGELEGVGNVPEGADCQVYREAEAVLLQGVQGPERVLETCQGRLGGLG